MAKRTEHAALADLPDAIARAIGDLPCGPVVASATGTFTCRIGADRPRCYLKFGPRDGTNPVSEEASRLRWLETAGVSAPRLVECSESGDTGYMLMTALPGRQATEAVAENPGLVAVLAEALRGLHNLTVPCPFVASSAVRLAQAEARLRRGEVDAAGFEAENRGLEPHELFTRLATCRPAREDAVVVHGDATLDNILIANGRVTGFVDVGRLGVSDRHCDLAIMARSLRNRISDAAAETFLDHYGRGDVDAERLAWYRLLDEFF